MSLDIPHPVAMALAAFDLVRDGTNGWLAGPLAIVLGGALTFGALRRSLAAAVVAGLGFLGISMVLQVAALHVPRGDVRTIAGVMSAYGSVVAEAVSVAYVLLWLAFVAVPLIALSSMGAGPPERSSARQDPVDAEPLVFAMLLAWTLAAYAWRWSADLAMSFESSPWSGGPCYLAWLSPLAASLWGWAVVLVVAGALCLLDRWAWRALRRVCGHAGGRPDCLDVALLRWVVHATCLLAVLACAPVPW